MRYIIAGQLALWVNVILVISAYFLVKDWPFNEFMDGLLGFIASLSSLANFVFSVALQVHGYQELKVLNKGL